MAKRQTINPPLNIYKKIALSFIILTLILIGLIFYFTLSYAYINVYPNKQEITTDFNFIVVEDPAAENIEEGIFNGKIVNQTLEGEKNFMTTGTKQKVGDIVGKVKLINNLSRDQVLVATTRLLTPEGILFRLKNRVNIPAGDSIEADVYADDPSKPLAKADTKFAIPGLSATLQEFVYAEADQDFVADGEMVSAISQEELDQAVESFSEELAQQIFAEDDSNKAKILTKEIIEREISNEVGDEVSEYMVNLTVKVIGIIFDEKPVQIFAEKVLEGAVSLDKEIVATNSDNLIYEIEKYDLDNKLAQIKTNIAGVVIISEDSEILDKDKLAKLNFDEMKAYLENFDEIEKVEIGFFPSWLKKVPYFQDHIIVRIIK